LRARKAVSATGGLASQPTLPACQVTHESVLVSHHSDAPEDAMDHAADVVPGSVGGLPGRPVGHRYRNASGGSLLVEGPWDAQQELGKRDHRVGVDLEDLDSVTHDGVVDSSVVDVGHPQNLEKAILVIGPW